MSLVIIVSASHVLWISFFYLSFFYAIVKLTPVLLGICSFMTLDYKVFKRCMTMEGGRINGLISTVLSSPLGTAFLTKHLVRGQWIAQSSASWLNRLLPRPPPVSTWKCLWSKIVTNATTIRFMLISILVTRSRAGTSYIR